MPIQNTLPFGSKCGRRERESRREGRRERSLRVRSFACRGGRRHPGSPDGGVLRGASSQGAPRSVRRPLRVSPRVGRAPATADVRRSPRRGTRPVCATAHTLACTHHAPAADGRVLRSVLRPVHVDPHSYGGVPTSLVVRRSPRHHGWANPREWEEPTLGSDERASRGSPRVTAPLQGRGVARQKRKEVEASVPARIESSGRVARTSCSVAEVGRRRLASNKLGKRAPKRAAGSSERGPSSGSSHGG